MSTDIAAYPWAAHAHHMGHLQRAEIRWEVYLEIVPDADKRTVRGRIHFVAGDRHRESAWVFLEFAERDVRERFNEFSAVELWSLLESLGP
jgi:hypothetical protein